MTTPAPRRATDMTTKLSAHSVTGTVARLVELVEARGMRLVAVIDQRAEARAAGLTLWETTPVMFGSPAAGTPVMDAAPLAALDLPLTVLIWADGPQTKASHVSPRAVAARHGLAPELAARITGIDALTDALVAA